ncbi:MAG: glycosyltransferase family 9 protein, partial [Alphaproteobacteria bacterium]
DAFLRAATGEDSAVARPPRVLVDRPAAPRPPGDRLLLVHPGAGARERRTPFDVLAGVAARWRRGGHGDAGVVVGPADEDLAAAWSTRGFRVIRPPDAAALAGELAQAAAFLGNDSGPSHLAAAVGLPGLALFRASDPSTFAPRGERFGWLVLDGGADAIDRAWGALRRVVLDSPGGRH